MRKILTLTICLLACMGLGRAQTGFLLVTSTRMADASSAKTSGSVCVQPVTLEGIPTTIKVGGAGGQITFTPGCQNVSGGSFSIYMPDTALSSPINACLKVTIKDSIGRVILSKPCVQPTSASGSGWCSLVSGVQTCNFDLLPNTDPAYPYLTGPKGDVGTAAVVTSNGVNGGFLIPGNLTAGSSSAITSVTDPVLGTTPTTAAAKGLTSDATSYVYVFLDSAGRPVGSIDAAGRLNLDGYQPGGSVINLRNLGTLSSGSLIGHYAFGMKTDSNQMITSNGIFSYMNTNAQHNVNTQTTIKFSKGLDASACPSFCQPNGMVSFGPTDVGIYDGLGLNAYRSSDLSEINLQVNHVLQLRPRAPSDSFVFPNNSNNWLHIDTGKNLRFINDGSATSIQSVNDTATEFLSLSIYASLVGFNSPVVFNSTVKSHPATVDSFGACTTDNEGASAAVIDSTTATPGATVTGGGANHLKMYCNGTSWIVN